MAALLARGPAWLASRSLADLNAEAARQLKAGQHAAAAATYGALFAKAQASNLTHPELYVCHSNAAAAYLGLGLHAEALRHANRCQALAQASLRRCARGRGRGQGRGAGQGGERARATWCPAWLMHHGSRLARNLLVCHGVARLLRCGHSSSDACRPAHGPLSRPPCAATPRAAPPTSSPSSARARRCWGWA